MVVACNWRHPKPPQTWSPPWHLMHPSPRTRYPLLSEIPHPSLLKGSNIYGGTKIFPDYQAEEGESYFTLVHGIAHYPGLRRGAAGHLRAAQGLRVGHLLLRAGCHQLLTPAGFPKTGDPASRRTEYQRRAGHLHLRGRYRVRLPIRPACTADAKRPYRRRHPGTSARRAGRASSTTPARAPSSTRRTWPRAS